MNSTPTVNRQHSSTVNIELLLGDRVMNVAELGPSFLVVRDPIAVGTSQGEIRVTIDDRVYVVQAEFPNGIDPSARKQTYVRIGEIQKAMNA